MPTLTHKGFPGKFARNKAAVCYGNARLFWMRIKKLKTRFRNRLHAWKPEESHYRKNLTIDCGTIRRSVSLSCIISRVRLCLTLFSLACSVMRPSSSRGDDVLSSSVVVNESRFMLSRKALVDRTAVQPLRPPARPFPSATSTTRRYVSTVSRSDSWNK